MTTSLPMLRTSTAAACHVCISIRVILRTCCGLYCVVVLCAWACQFCDAVCPHDLGIVNVKMAEQRILFSSSVFFADSYHLRLWSSSSMQLAIQRTRLSTVVFPVAGCRLSNSLPLMSRQLQCSLFFGIASRHTSSQDHFLHNS